ncbi:PstS family phosphate ABC transporter substrate-binding protein [Umezawaea endophytica]|uniref:Substrate-binding domain-containing protein n=1 Tax=Umezawaea endophytica TaxID=1654476 RepID=A0A9X2VEZ6_9PSEU|nr:substrate-binding domain-containing protein [Umezawaea endophytica]MCS7475264.1 substrate-binding domain-containing protein [Umezawaea endophytica]
MVVLRALQSVLDFLGPGNVVLGIVLLIATPFVDRFLIRRKRITYRVLYNSKIGLGLERLHDGTEPARAGQRQLYQVAELLDRMSIVVIRIRNTGGYDIDADDFDRPLSFTFGRRVVWNARVSEASTEEIRERVRAGLRFFGAEGSHDPVDRDSLRTVRERLPLWMARWVGTVPSPKLDVEQHWHGVRVEDLALRRKQKFKLVVILREPDDSGVTKDIEATGKLKDSGLLKDEKRERLITLPRATGALAALLTVFLVLSLVFVPPPADSTVACASGEVRIEGSSVFMPTASAIAQDFQRVCESQGTRITTAPTGSVEGVRAVSALGPDDLGLLALADGRQRTDGATPHSEQIGIVVYHVVVNASVGLDTVTTAQLRSIYDGTTTDWNQVRGGESLPIRIVGRGGESGSRELFEQKVLGTGEGELSSNGCRTKDRNPEAATIRCERGSNPEVAREVGRTEGAIGYADAPSVAQARKDNPLTALTVDGKAFDPAVGVDSGYPFWTVEYLYARKKPEPGSVAANFVDYLLRHDSARARLTDAGYLPCTTSEGAPLELCNHR